MTPAQVAINADLAGFLLARIAEDEAAAAAATPGSWIVAPDDPTVVTHEDGNDDDDYIADAYALSSRQQRANATHIARHNPARVLAECDAKRGLIHDAGDVPTVSMRRALKWLALPYAEHPDYNEVWRP